MAIRITALGPLRVEQDGRLLDRLPAKRMRLGILLYLAVEREATREQLMGMFWGDRPPERARHLLSQTLYELRQDLGEEWMTAAGEQIAATPELVADAKEFADAVGDGRYEEALALHGGGFLSGASLSLGRSFEGWVDAQEARITRLHRQACRRAIDGLAEAGALEEALARARAWAELDPLDDEAQHRLIELMAATGDRSGALRQYDRYAALVESQLELEPLDDTRALVERIRQGEVGERRTPAVPQEATPPAEAAAAPASGGPGGGERVPDEGATAPSPAWPVFERRDPARPPAGTRVDAAFRWLRRHSMVRWTLAYLTGAVVMLEGVSSVVDAFSLSARLVQGVALALGAGALGVLGFGWLHAERERRIGVPEAVILGLVALFGVWVANDLRRPSAAAAAEAELDPRRIAVLYFDDHSPEQDLAPIAAGFTEALIHELHQAEGLEILSRTAVEPYRTNKPTLDSIIRDLRPGTLVEGSLTRVGDSLRVTFQLIDGATRTHHLSGTLHRPVSEVHTIVRDLPQLVALQLRKRLGERILLSEARTSASNAEAWTLVQRARVPMEDRRVYQEDFGSALALLERADSLLEEAEALDPSWVEPPLQRARVAGHMARFHSATPGRYDPAHAQAAIVHVDRALAIDPEDPRILEERGLLLFELAEAAGAADDLENARLYREAEADLRTAVELNPRQARAWWTLSRLLRRKGSLAEGKQAARRALEADAFLQVPVGGLFQLFQMALEMEEHREAAEWCTTLRERYPDNMRWVQCELLLLGTSPPHPPDPGRAWVLVDSIVERGSEENAPVFSAWAKLYVAKTLVRAGLPDSARAVLERTLPDRPPPKWAAYDLAHAYLMLGDVDRSLELLEIRARENPGPAGSLATDWWFRPLHGDPRLEQLIRRATEAEAGR